MIPALILSKLHRINCLLQILTYVLPDKLFVTKVPARIPWALRSLYLTATGASPRRHLLAAGFPGTLYPLWAPPKACVAVPRKSHRAVTRPLSLKGHRLHQNSRPLPYAGRNPRCLEPTRVAPISMAAQRPLPRHRRTGGRACRAAVGAPNRSESSTH